MVCEVTSKPQPLKAGLLALLQVPACVQALTNLKRLSLEGNNIQTVPEGHYLLGTLSKAVAVGAAKLLACLLAHSFPGQQ